MVGGLMRLATISRPDIAFAAGKLAQNNTSLPEEALNQCC